jgi:hypothetical protein
VPDGAVDRQRPQVASESHEAFGVAGRVVAVAAAKIQHPAVAFERVHQGASGALGCPTTEGHDAFPIRRGILGNGEDGRGVAHIDSDRCLLRQRSAGRLQQGERRSATPGGVDDEIGRERFPRVVPGVATDARNRRAIRCRQQFLDTAALAEPDVRQPFHTPSYRVLDGRP